MNDQIIISVSKDFTQYPGARYRSDGEHSGQEFYENILKPKLQSIWENSNNTILLDLDGTYGYASSFTSEVFTRLVKDFVDKKLIKKKILYKSDDEPLLINTINNIIDETQVR